MNEKNSILLLLSFFRYNWMKFVYIWNYTHISTWSLFANHTVRCFFHNFCFLLFSFLFLSFKNIVFKSHIERSHHSIQFFFSLKFPTHFPISFSIDSKSLLRKKNPEELKISLWNQTNKFGKRDTTMIRWIVYRSLLLLLRHFLRLLDLPWFEFYFFFTDLSEEEE